MQLHDARAWDANLREQARAAQTTFRSCYALRNLLSWREFAVRKLQKEPVAPYKGKNSRQTKRTTWFVLFPATFFFSRPHLFPSPCLCSTACTPACKLFVCGQPWVCFFRPNLEVLFLHHLCKTNSDNYTIG
jgi:hypothetical protein